MNADEIVRRFPDDIRESLDELTRAVRDAQRRRFDLAWEEMAFLGCCDGHGGKEYVRVLCAWKANGRPMNVVGFILRHANAIPTSSHLTN